MYKLNLLIKLYFITDCILTNLIFLTCIYFMWYLYFKILFGYLLDIYYNELKFIYPNNFERLNSNKTQYKYHYKRLMAHDVIF